MKLKDILLEFGPVRAEAKRRFRQALILAESRQPQTGAYWFVPKSKWEIYPFFESLHGEVLHANVWDRYLAKVISGHERPSRDLRLAYAGLPRGRVAIVNGQHVIYHGNDSPGGERGLKLVAKSFNLPSYKAVFDDHEVMIAEHYYVVRAALGYKNKLKPPAEPEFDDDDYDFDF